MPCKCGHDWDDHAQGDHRRNHFCEAPNCDCPDYESDVTEEQQRASEELIRETESLGLYEEM
jgi:hypothetical protein